MASKKNFYVVFSIKKKDKKIVTNYNKAKEILKKSGYTCKGFETEEEALKFNPFETQKKYYIVYSIKKQEKILVEDYDSVLSINENGGYTCKSFKTKKEALEFNPFKKKENNLLSQNLKTNLISENGIYFDFGTGRGIGGEIRVTDCSGETLLYQLENYKLLINEFGNLNLGDVKDTQYGELYGLYLALLIAKQNQYNNLYHFIAGDNIFTIECSLGKYNDKKFKPYESDLIKAVFKLTQELKTRYKIDYISGDKNPADLGFHR